MAEMIRGAVIGYGPAFNMGKHHASQMTNTEGIECVAICDIDRSRTRAAKKDFPNVTTYNSLRTMLKKGDYDLISVVLPHNLHAEVAIKCLKAGKNVIVEKPMCISIAEGTVMFTIFAGMMFRSQSR